MPNLLRKTHGEVLTPDWLIDKMLLQAGDLTGKKVADLGANRGQYLKRALLMYPTIDPKDWTLLEVQERYIRYHRRFTGWRVEKELNEPVDILLGNPPYNGGLDLKLILKYKRYCGRILVVHPSTWLVDVKTQLGPKSGNPTFRKFQDMISPHITSAHMFNGNPVFDIGLFVPCVITDADMSRARAKGHWIDVRYVGDEEGVTHKVTDLNEITLHGPSWRTCMKDFFLKMQQECKVRGSLHSNIVTASANTSKFPVQLAAITGNWTASSAQKMVKDNFYTFVQKDPNNNRGLRNKAYTVGNVTPTYFLNSKQEQDNFINYLQTDFARLCLALTKIGPKIAGVEIQLVPWMDFSRPWTDEDLFTEFGYPPGHHLREYAKRFLPDYHGIGKNY